MGGGPPVQSSTCHQPIQHTVCVCVYIPIVQYRLDPQQLFPPSCFLTCLVQKGVSFLKNKSSGNACCILPCTHLTANTRLISQLMRLSSSSFLPVIEVQRAPLEGRAAYAAEKKKKIQAKEIRRRTPLVSAQTQYPHFAGPQLLFSCRHSSHHLTETSMLLASLLVASSVDAGAKGHSSRV